MLKRLWMWLVALALVLGHGGLSESLENLGHLVVSGHVAHADTASDDDEHDSHRDIEHGCVGAFHTCVCCGHQPMFFLQVDVMPPPPMESLESFAGGDRARGPAGERRRIFRPPVV